MIFPKAFHLQNQRKLEKVWFRFYICFSDCYKVKIRVLFPVLVLNSASVDGSSIPRSSRPTDVCYFSPYLTSKISLILILLPCYIFVVHFLVVVINAFFSVVSDIRISKNPKAMGERFEIQIISFVRLKPRLQNCNLVTWSYYLISFVFILVLL